MSEQQPIPFSQTRRAFLVRSAAVAAVAGVSPVSGVGTRAQDATPVAEATPVAVATQSAVVATTSGPVTGLTRDGITSYKGIRYATPPLDELRWTAPQPMTPWSEPFAASDFCSDCMQVAGPEDIGTTPSEDCLALNVWTPEGTAADAALPVMIWIHGGGYVGGGSSIPWFDGGAFARHGMVVVSFNYRLGHFGYFIPSAVLNNTAAPYGNYGYLDQLAALRWAHDNVAAFGGDPHRVTLAGESAGGASVVHHLTSPMVEDGLFQQAVIMSGGGRLALLDRPMERGGLFRKGAVDIDNDFADSVGIDGAAPADLDKLRAVDAATMVGDLTLKEMIPAVALGTTLAGVPVDDGEFVVGQPVDHFENGTAKTMPLLIGTTATDVPTHFPPDLMRPLHFFEPDEDAARKAYGVEDKWLLSPQDLLDLRIDVGMDLTMHEPAHFVASTMTDAGHRAWVYRFTYTAESTRPEHESQVHAGELPFFFDNVAAKYGDETTANDLATGAQFNTYVANFVIGGDPNGAGLPEWPPMTPGQYDVMDFTLDDGPVFGPDPRESVALVAAALQRQQED